MNIHFNSDRILEGLLLILILVWGLYIITEAAGYEPLFAWLLPLIVAIPLVVLVLVQFTSWRSDMLRSSLSRIKLDQSINIENIEQDASVSEIVIFIISILLYILIAVIFGFFYAIPIYLYVYLRLYDCYRPRKAIILTLLIWFGVSFMFGSLFNVPGVEFGPFSRIEIGIF